MLIRHHTLLRPDSLYQSYNTICWTKISITLIGFCKTILKIGFQYLVSPFHHQTVDVDPVSSQSVSDCRNYGSWTGTPVPDCRKYLHSISNLMSYDAWILSFKKWTYFQVQNSITTKRKSDLVNHSFNDSWRAFKTPGQH